MSASEATSTKRPIITCPKCGADNHFGKPSCGGSGGISHSLLVSQDGSVWTVGANDFFQLGDGTNKERRFFVKVLNSGARAVGVGYQYSILLKQDGSVWATGRNFFGQFGDGSKAILACPRCNLLCEKERAWTLCSTRWSIGTGDPNH